MWLKQKKEGAKFRVLDDEGLLESEAAWRTGRKEVEIESEIVSL